jgi:hypothetical protein
MKIPKVGLLQVAIAFPLAALVIGRWWVPIVAAATMIGFAVVLIADEGWEGADWGELGFNWDLLLATLTVTGSVIGVGLNRFVREFFEGRTDT